MGIMGIMGKSRAILLTHRSPLHQRQFLEAAPENLDLTILASPSPEAISEAIGEVEFVFSERSGRINAAHISAARHLRLIQRIGSQVHDIDLDAARKAGVPVCTYPLRQCGLVAEHALMQMLALAKQARLGSEIVVEAADWGAPRECTRDTFAINWAGLHNVASLVGSTVGIIGFGEIGVALAKRLAGFECTILYNRRNRLPRSVEDSLGVDYAEINELLPRCDIVCLLLPTAQDTIGIVDADFLARLKQGAILVNSGASTTLDEGAVAEAYRTGRLGGIATDGFRWEPVRADNPLVLLAADRRANVVLTPHSALAGFIVSPVERRAEFSNAIAVLQGRPLEHRVV